MATLPDRPDLDQLRRRARELLRAANDGDRGAILRFEALAAPLTLAGAQLVIAREHGEPSWPALRDEVMRRREHSAYVLRRVRDIDDLKDVYVTIGAQHPRGLTHEDWRFGRLLPRFEPDRTMLLAVEHGGALVAGGLGTRKSDDATTVGMFVGVAEGHRGLGIGRRIVDTIEREAMVLGLAGLGLGGATEAERGFYRALGFAGKHSYLHKGLPLAGRARDHLVAKWLRERPNLDAGAEFSLSLERHR